MGTKPEPQLPTKSQVENSTAKIRFNLPLNHHEAAKPLDIFKYSSFWRKNEKDRKKTQNSKFLNQILTLKTKPKN